MKFNFELTVVSLITIASLISPVIVAYLNNKHSEKMKRLELEKQFYENDYLHKRDIFENFLKFLGMRTSHSLFSDSDFQEYVKSTWNVYPYLKDEPVMEEIINSLDLDYVFGENTLELIKRRLIPRIRHEIINKSQLS